MSVPGGQDHREAGTHIFDVTSTTPTECCGSLPYRVNCGPWRCGCGRTVRTVNERFVPVSERDRLRSALEEIANLLGPLLGGEPSVCDAEDVYELASEALRVSGVPNKDPKP